MQLSFIRSADRPLLWINILFLLWVALVPLSTALLSEYTTLRLAVAVYGANLIAIGLTLALHWWYATAGTRHVDPNTHTWSGSRRHGQNADGTAALSDCNRDFVLQH